MVPSPHRAPANQVATVYLGEGKHELIVAIEKAADREESEWVVAVADGKTKIWHPLAFLPNVSAG
jgi:hypothetical protein